MSTMDNTNEAPVSLTEALNAHGIALSAVAAGKVLLVGGITAVEWRESSKPGRPQKSYKVATTYGESLGAVNERNTLPTGDPTNLKFDRNRFAGLWASRAVQDALADLLDARDVRYRDGAAKGPANEIF
jgi:hypothetical protein